MISIILGFLLGGVLISPKISAWLLAFDMPMVDLGSDAQRHAAKAGCRSHNPGARLYFAHLVHPGELIFRVPETPS